MSPKLSTGLNFKVILSLNMERIIWKVIDHALLNVDFPAMDAGISEMPVGYCKKLSLDVQIRNINLSFDCFELDFSESLCLSMDAGTKVSKLESLRLSASMDAGTKVSENYRHVTEKYKYRSRKILAAEAA